MENPGRRLYSISEAVRRSYEGMEFVSSSSEMKHSLNKDHIKILDNAWKTLNPTTPNKASENAIQQAITAMGKYKWLKYSKKEEKFYCHSCWVYDKSKCCEMEIMKFCTLMSYVNGVFPTTNKSGQKKHVRGEGASIAGVVEGGAGVPDVLTCYTLISM